MKRESPVVRCKQSAARFPQTCAKSSKPAAARQSACNKIIAAQAVNNNLIKEFPSLQTFKYSTNDMKLMYLSGTSMSTPMVSGAASLLFELNPKLTPNMIKMILMYTAQPLAGYNTLDQGTGQLNIAGSVAVSRLVKGDLLLGLLGPTFGSSLLTQTAPSPQTTISSYTFPWAQGVILQHTTVTGKDLITKYQVSYGNGYVLGDGVNEGLVSQSLNYKMWTSNVVLGNYLMKSDGSPMPGGIIFLSTVILLGDGFALGDEFAMGDGFAMGRWIRHG